MWTVINVAQSMHKLAIMASEGGRCKLDQHNHHSRAKSVKRYIIWTPTTGEILGVQRETDSECDSDLMLNMHTV